MHVCTHHVQPPTGEALDEAAGELNLETRAHQIQTLGTWSAPEWGDRDLWGFYVCGPLAEWPRLSVPRLSGPQCPHLYHLHVDGFLTQNSCSQPKLLHIRITWATRQSRHLLGSSPDQVNWASWGWCLEICIFSSSGAPKAENHPARVGPHPLIRLPQPFLEWNAVLLCPAVPTSSGPPLQNCSLTGSHIGKVLFAIICCWKGFSKMVAILAKCIFQEVRSGVEKNLKVILEPCLPFPDCVWEGSHFPGLLLWFSLPGGFPGHVLRTTWTVVSGILQLSPSRNSSSETLLILGEWYPLIFVQHFKP